jgi:hypothetical protein
VFGPGEAISIRIIIITTTIINNVIIQGIEDFLGNDTLHTKRLTLPIKIII